MYRQDTRRDPCLHWPLCYTQFPVPPHCHAVCGLPELVSRTRNLICTICNDWRQLCGVLLNIYCQENGKVIYLTRSKLPRCEFLVAGTLCAFPPFLPIGKPPHLNQVSMVWRGWEHGYRLCAKTRDSGICPQAGTTAVWRGIRRLRKMWSALPPCPCPPSLLFSNSEFFSPRGWWGRRRVSRGNACQRARPGRPGKGRRSHAVLFGGGRTREMIEPWNLWTGQWVELA